MPQGPDIFMSLSAVGLLASSEEALLIVAIRLLAPPRAVCFLAGPAEECDYFCSSLPCRSPEVLSDCLG